MPAVCYLLMSCIYMYVSAVDEKDQTLVDIGPIIRHDTFGDQTWCMENRQMKPFCYCVK